jgi:hypothetical protein
MNKKIEIGKPLTVEVSWYDKCTVPPADKKFEGEIIGWRNTQVIVSVKSYAVLRFWKKSGLEVGNKDYSRRGFSIDMEALKHILSPGVSVTFSDDDGPMPVL